MKNPAAKLPTARSQAGLSRRELLRYSSAAGLAAVVSASGVNVHGQKKKEEKFLTLSHSVNTTVYAPHMVAQELGFFKELGLNCTFVVPGGGARVAQVLAGGQAGFGLGDSNHPVKITERGKPCLLLYGTDTRCSYANIVVRKELWDQGLNSPEKLATMKRPDGSPRVIAATAIGSGTWVYGNVVLSQYTAHGKPVHEQVKWVSGGSSTGMLGGLKSGQFDAIMAVPIWMDAAISQGFGAALYDVTSNEAWLRVFKGDVPTTVGYALKATIDADPEMTQDYVTAVYRAMQWMKGHKPEEIFEKIGPKYMATFSKEEVVKEIQYYQAIFNYDLRVTRKDFENTKRVFIPWVTEKDFTYDAIVDMRFVEQAHKA
jgi:NitT/TauT family transport system substrate-binding protein